ncbi:universal stress protein [Klebsiella quasipneumoniae]|uniref:universal stress protein n=1 Tax=Klebsiella quasipneumoniae TaxID=1463165 RepID=UPI000DE633F2|nr:universal stress protein [Klebsiella quasipneumoniae]MCW9418823.1 universal stress protein [Klebsiella quasipneumoniae]SSG40624.1 Universal stress protein family [Klebsiella pneumoniae]
MNNTVLACVDGSLSTRSVCEYAAWAASALHSKLALLHVIEKDSTPVVSDLTGTLGIDSQQLLTDELVEIERQRNRLLMAQGKAILESCAELLQKEGALDVFLMQKHGTPDEILAELCDLRLMVLGRRGSQHPVGSHLENVIRLQKKPLLVVPENYSAPSRAMFAYDGSEESRRNLERLTMSPLLSGLECHLVMVNGKREELSNAQQILRDAGIENRSVHLSGQSVRDTLIRYAEENAVDLIVMGAYGHSRLRRFLIGSHTSEMLQNTSQPLLILR